MLSELITSKISKLKLNQPKAVHPFRALVENDLIIVNQIVLENLHSDVSLIKEIAQYILSGGGKKLRPILVLLSAKLFNYDYLHHLTLAAAIELIHTATLLHDDVVDHSAMRRGRPTANYQFGDTASVLVGDFLYSRAFQMLLKVGNLDIMKVLTDAPNLIAEGEVLQLSNTQDNKLTEERYLETIRRKTATLFEAAAQLGPLLCERPPTEVAALAEYGRCIGLAFQLVDDALDYGSSETDIGKNLGDDLAEGKITLPLIQALKQGNAAQKAIINRAVTEREIKNLSNIIEIFASTKAIEYTYDLAKNYAHTASQALLVLPKCSARNSLEELAQFTVERTY